VNIPFLNLAAQSQSLLPEVQQAIAQVLERAHFVLGPNVQSFEKEIAELTQTQFGIGVNSGSDALTLSLGGLGLGPGDEVITSPFTYIAPAESIHQVGAKIVFADIDPVTFCIDPIQIQQRLTPQTRALLPVHLFGQAASMDRILPLAQSREIHIVEDCAQAIGASCQGRPVGGFGAAGCFSFYPTKNLGAHGDGGMIVTNDEELAQRIRTLRVHGMTRRYYHDHHGYNSRLDEIQAAVLRVKLKHLSRWNRRRAAIAARYDQGLANLPLVLPQTTPGNNHVYHVYAVLTDKRDALQQCLTEHGIATLIYYPLPLHRQKVYAELGYREGEFPVAEDIAKRILPLPIYPELGDDQVDYIIQTIRQFPF
jgi:dTDP-4-amino-4,6-dideoxygalactose transaminase